MFVKFICIVLIVFLVFDNNVHCQNVPQKSDSNDIYKYLEVYSKRSKLTKIAYRLIFKSIDANPNQSVDLIHVPKSKNLRSYKKCEGKIIRKIHIETIDPFAYSLLDKRKIKQNMFINLGNKAHIKSQQITIRNLLLVKQNQRFDSLIVNESERLVRNQTFVQDVEISVERILGTNDSVDIFIVVLDKWSLVPGFTSTNSRLKWQLTDKNIFGIGHEFHNAYTRNRQLDRNAYKVNYFIPNINHTYLNSTILFEVNEYKYVNASLNIDRPFFSPLTKWAAGIKISHQYNQDSFYYYRFGAMPYYYKFNSRDYWIGRAWQIFKGRTENERTTNLILAARFKHIKYDKTSNSFSDTFQIYLNEDLFLLGLGISSRKYVQDHYIFGFGITEDVPVGKIYGLTGGIQVRGAIRRSYIGLRYATGYYNYFGYLGGQLEYGTFIHRTIFEQGIISLSFDYFTKLLVLRNWKFRAFIRPQMLYGIHRNNFERLSLNEANGLDGFNSSLLFGKNRLLLNFQTQSYAPWHVFGFYFGPYVNYSMGMLSNAETGFSKSKVYTQLAIGVLLKNEKLVFSSFQLSVSFFPLVPGVGQDIFKFNSFQTTNFGFKDFVLDKPYIAKYN